MTPDFSLRKGDLLPVLQLTCEYDDGTPVNLTSATSVVLNMILSGETTKKISGVAVTVVTAATGEVSYAWTGTDTDTPGDYLVWVVAVFPTSKPISCPGRGYFRVTIEDDHE